MNPIQIDATETTDIFGAKRYGPGSGGAEFSAESGGSECSE